MVALLSEYALGWCLHQLAPFLDRALVFAGLPVVTPMDHRMIKQPYDYYLRLPLILLCLVKPSRPVLLVAHVVNIICWFERMPGVWDYMCWCALLEATFVLAALFSSSCEECARKFLPACRAELVVLYFSAAWWKLTTSWFDPAYSCSTVLTSELMAGVEPVLPPIKHLSDFMMAIAPLLVAGIEFAVPSLLLFRPRWGVLLALTFHQTINLMPTTYAGGFSISMCCRLLIFVPGLTTTFMKSKLKLPAFGLVGLVTAFMYGIHKTLDMHGLIFLALALVYFWAISAEYPQETNESMASPVAYALPKALIVTALSVYGSYATVGIAVVLLASWAPETPFSWMKKHAMGLGGCAAAMGFLYGFLFPVAGVMMMASSTMYGNVKNYGGGNHLIVPTGLLQDAYAETAAPGFLRDFSGGLVRVDRTTSPSLLKLAVNGADTTHELPPRSHELLKSINASGRYFQFYAARNYFDRPEDLAANSLNAIKSSATKGGDSSYVVPAYELRRALTLSRELGEVFKLEYTRLPAQLRTQTAWKAYVGPSIAYEELGNGLGGNCTLVRSGGKSKCSDDELVNQKPPSWWLTKLLHPYPIPLLEGASNEIHCST